MAISISALSGLPIRHFGTKLDNEVICKIGSLAMLVLRAAAAALRLQLLGHETKPMNKRR